MRDLSFRIGSRRRSETYCIRWERRGQDATPVLSPQGAETDRVAFGGAVARPPCVDASVLVSEA
jgi:hypothetical protein